MSLIHLGYVIKITNRLIAARRYREDAERLVRLLQPDYIKQLQVVDLGEIDKEDIIITGGNSDTAP